MSDFFRRLEPWTTRQKERFVREALIVRKSFALLWDCSPLGVLGILILTIISAGNSIVMAIVAKHIVDAIVMAKDHPTLTTASLQNVMGFITLECFLFLTQIFCDRLVQLVHRISGRRFGTEMTVLLMKKAQSLELSHFEDSDFYDKLLRARREASTRPIRMMQSYLVALRSVLTLVGFATILVGYNPLVALGFLLTTVPAFLSELSFTRRTYELVHQRSPQTRKLAYLEHIVSSDAHAKEMKSFELARPLTERYQAMAEALQQEDKALAVRSTWVTTGLTMLTTVFFYGCYVVIALAAARNEITLGEMTLYLMAFRQGKDSIQTILTTFSGIYEHNLYMSNVFEYLEIPATPPRRSTTSNDPDPTAGISLQGVGFRYQGSDEWVLQDINIHISPGSSLAILGLNGSGKTTLIKIIVGLYAPTAGSVQLDGRSLDAWEPTALRARMAILFQDFNRYQFTAAENIAAGCGLKVSDESSLREAADQAAISDAINRLPSGLQTQLGRWFPDGIELSGGQWQRLALSRIFARPDADIVVLDEPTSATDAVAEHELFSRLIGGELKQTVILVSHRISVARRADHIIVLDKGRIIEQGTHEQLIDKNARYTQMFALQSRGYK